MPRETLPGGGLERGDSKRDASNGAASSLDAMSVSSKTPTPEKMIISRTKEKSVYTANERAEQARQSREPNSARTRAESNDTSGRGRPPISSTPIPSAESGEYGRCGVVGP